MGIQISDAAVLANDEVVLVVPNSVEYTEGKGEQTNRPMSTGGGGVEMVASNNIEGNKSTLKFKVPTTKEMVDLALSWKIAFNGNVFQIAGENADGSFLTRTFTQAVVVNDYGVPLGSETEIEIEIHSAPAI